MSEYEEKIKKAIKNCYWRQEFEGVDICRGMVLPCSRIIEKGQCDTIAKIIREELAE